MNTEFDQIAEELVALGHIDEARELSRITASVVVEAPIIEAVRLLDGVQASACRDPKLMNVAARASLLSHHIQSYYKR